jgi:ABC-type glycerol-3-phosphate transport system substrate-binding protein
VGGNGFWLINHQDSQRAGAAFEVIRWLGDPAQMGRFDVATGYIPPSEAVANTPAVTAAWRVHPQLKVGYDQLHAMSATASAAGPLYGPSSEIDALFWDLTNAILDRHVSPAEALTSASKNANKLIATYDDMKQSQSSMP